MLNSVLGDLAKRLRASQSSDGFTWTNARQTFRLFTYGSKLIAETRIRSHIAFKLGEPEPTFEVRTVVSGERSIYETGLQGLSPVRWLSSERNLRLVDRLALGAGESLVVATNVSVLTIAHRSADEDEARLRLFAEVTQHLPRRPRGATRWPSGLGKLQDLHPMFEHWSESDDVVRVGLISQASTADLLALVSEVIPRLSEIDDWLDKNQNDDPAPLDRLAQAAIEAEVELERRGVEHRRIRR